MRASYTMWSTYNTCPAQYYALYVSKECERAESDALTKGIEVHDTIEQYLLGEAENYSEHVHAGWRETIDELAEMTRVGTASPEVKLSNNIAHGKLDVLVEYPSGQKHIIDWKTGKARKNDISMREQLKFYVWLIGESAKASLYWVEHPPSKSLTITIPYTNTLDRVWRQRIDRMFNADSYPAEPSWKCSWCPYHGCPHNKEGENE